MKILLLIIQLVVALTLTSLILLQNSKGGLQTQIGGADFYRTKRGAEKIVFSLTVFFSVAFFSSRS